MAPDTSHKPQVFPRAVAAVAGIGFVGFGLWGMVAPQSFFDAAADFPPYNQHFLQDIGAFLIGLGSVLLLAVVRPSQDALAPALLGVAVGSGAHTLSHIVGRDLGGQPAIDIPVFALITVLLVAAGAQRSRRQ